MYYEIWQQFDPNGTQYIKYNQLSDFLDVLESPLQIHKPNKYKIISMDIPICKGDLCFCVDVLDALTKDFFARKGNPVEETAELGEVTAQADRPGYDPISSTLWRQREEYCARMIQVFSLKTTTNDYSDTETGGLDSYNADKRLFQGVWRRQTRLEELGLAEPLPVRTLLYFDHKWLFYC